MCRFTPTNTGSWSFTINIAGAATATTSGSFAVIAAGAGPGFVRLSSKDSAYFIRDDTNSTFFPIGTSLVLLSHFSCLP